MEFAKANAMRPRIVGAALQKILQDPEVAETMFEVLETEQILASENRLTILPKGHEMLSQLLAAEQKPAAIRQRPDQTDSC